MVNELNYEPKKDKLPLFVSLSLSDQPINSELSLLSSFDSTVFDNKNGCLLIQGGHLRPIFPLETGIVYHYENLLKDKSIKWLEAMPDIAKELFRNELINNPVRDTIIYELISKIKKERKVTYRLFLNNGMPIINKWLNDLILLYRPYEANFEGLIKGKKINYNKLNICVCCFKKIGSLIPDDNLCRNKQSKYQDNCKEKYSKWLKELNGFIFTSRLQLLEIFFGKTSSQEEVKKSFRVTQIITKKIASVFFTKLITKNGKVISKQGFTPFADLETDKYVWADEKSSIYKELIEGVKRNDKDILGKLEKKYNLRTYELYRLLLSHYFIENTGEKLNHLPKDIGSFISLISLGAKKYKEV